MPGVVHIVDDDASFRTAIERRLKKRDTKLRVPVGSALARPSAGRAWPRPSHHEATRDTKSKLDIVRAHIAALTPREREVFALVICGKTNKHVAHELGATELTIKAHRHRVMEKMQVQSLAELVSLDERVSIWMARSSSGMVAQGKGK